MVERTPLYQFFSFPIFLRSTIVISPYLSIGGTSFPIAPHYHPAQWGANSKDSPSDNSTLQSLDSPHPPILSIAIVLAITLMLLWGRGFSNPNPPTHLHYLDCNGCSHSYRLLFPMAPPTYLSPSQLLKREDGSRLPSPYASCPPIGGLRKRRESNGKEREPIQTAHYEEGYP